MINPPSMFGQPDEAPQAAVPEEPAPRGRRTLVIAVAAGVVALGALGGAAALTLGGGSDTPDLALPPAAVAPVEPSLEPSLDPATALPTTGEVRGRNVFVPLVTDSGGDAAAAVPGGGATTPARPTAAATAGSSSSGSGGGSSSSSGGGVGGGSGSGSGGGFGGGGTEPRPTVTVTRSVEVPVPGPTTTVPGPTVTVPGPSTTVPGPTVTVTPEPETVPGVQFHSLEVSVVEDDQKGHLATFAVTYEKGEKPKVYADLSEGFPAQFGRDREFSYLGYEDGRLEFGYGDSTFVMFVPVTEPVG